MQVPYHRYSFGPAEEEAVLRVMRSGWLTAGNEVELFEQELAAKRGMQAAVALNSCTAGLFLLLQTAHLPPGAEVVTTPLTFAATANSILHAGLRPVFADVDPSTLNLTAESIDRVLTPLTRAVIVVHLAGHPCDMEPIRQLCASKGLVLIEDCAHALEASIHGQPVGSFGRGGAFSFYPNKNITTGEGGAVLTNDGELAKNLRIWRNHGLSRDARAREHLGNLGAYDIVVPGYKLILNEMQAALGRVQLGRLEEFTHKRNEKVAFYATHLQSIPALNWLKPLADSQSAWHLFLIRLQPEQLKVDRSVIVAELLSAGIQVSLPYTPVHLFSHYTHLGYKPGLAPVAEAAAPWLISLPLYPDLTTDAQSYVCDTLNRVICNYLR